MLVDFAFHSSDHIRYERGEHVSGPHGGARRVIKLEANVSGHQGYEIVPGDGYIVTVYNADGVHPLWQDNVQMTPKPMRIVSQSSDKVVLRGYPVRAMGPFGWIDFPGQNYGLTILYENSRVVKCILHMHDRLVDIEYLP